VGTSHNPTGKPFPSDRQSYSFDRGLFTPEGIRHGTNIYTVPTSQSAFTTAPLTELERPLDSAPPGDIWRQNVQKCGPLELPTQFATVDTFRYSRHQARNGTSSDLPLSNHRPGAATLLRQWSPASTDPSADYSVTAAEASQWPPGNLNEASSQLLARSSHRLPAVLQPLPDKSTCRGRSSRKRSFQGPSIVNCANTALFRSYRPTAKTQKVAISVSGCLKCYNIPQDDRTQDNRNNGGATKTYLRTIGTGCNNLTLHM
jgi:hypothetical protein